MRVRIAHSAFGLALAFGLQGANAEPPLKRANQSFASCVIEAVESLAVDSKYTLVDQKDPWLKERGLAPSGKDYGLCGPTCAVNMMQVFLKLEGRPLLARAVEKVETVVHKSYLLGEDGRRGLTPEILRMVLASTLREQRLDAEVQSGTVLKHQAYGRTPLLQSIDKSQITGGNTPGRLSIIALRGYPEGTLNSITKAHGTYHYMLALGDDPEWPGYLRLVDPNRPNVTYVGHLTEFVDQVTGQRSYKINFISPPPYMIFEDLLVTDYVSATLRSPRAPLTPVRQGFKGFEMQQSFTEEPSRAKRGLRPKQKERESGRWDTIRPATE